MLLSFSSTAVTTIREPTLMSSTLAGGLALIFVSFVTFTITSLPSLSFSTTLSDPQLMKPLFGLLHPPHVLRSADEQEPGKDLLDERADLRERE